jgi:drug/metabolite transporter (DMT)-like permease
MSGALTLWLLMVVMGRAKEAETKGVWLSAGMLAAYAIGFSFAYRELSTGTGALILFAAVQATMIVAGMISGERPTAFQWIGLVGAMGGLFYLVSPGLSAPAPLGSALMASAGVAWGVYSVRGKGSGDPAATTAANFLRAVPLVVVVSLFMWKNVQASGEGLLLAVLSGSVTSGIGYVIWYAALRGLTHTRAAVVQLAVPVLAAAGGILFLSEQVSLRLLVASAMILGGIALAVSKRGHK